MKANGQKVHRETGGPRGATTTQKEGDGGRLWHDSRLMTEPTSNLTPPPTTMADPHNKSPLYEHGSSTLVLGRHLRQSSTISFGKPAMGTEMVMVDEIPFPPEITASKPLALLGHGITDIEIHFLQIKFNAIGVYLDPAEIVIFLQPWKGKSSGELSADDSFFDALIAAKAETFLRIVVIKELKGSQYGVQLESAVRDRLAAIDKYEEEEEEALEKVIEFFQGKYLKKHSVITFLFPSSSNTAEIGFSTEGKEEAKFLVENQNVAGVLKDWYLGGSRAVSATTVASLADGLAAHLSS